MRSVINKKLNLFYARQKVGDEISSFIAFFDLAQLICIEEKINLENANSINDNWKYLYGKAVEKAFFQTMTHFKYPITSISEIKKFILIKRPEKESFNQIFKLYYNQNPGVAEIKQFFKKTIREFEPTLTSYLNKQKEDKEETLPKSFRGDLAFKIQ